MPETTNVQIGKSNFVFINGLPMGWFVNNKPVLFSPPREWRRYKKVRGGIAAVLSVKDTTLEHSISQPLGGLTKYQPKKCSCSVDYTNKNIVTYKLATKNRVFLRSEKHSYPWIVNYQIETILRENFLQVKVRVRRMNTIRNVPDPVINLSLYSYFAIGAHGFVSILTKKRVIFGKEESPNLIDENDYWIESLGGKMLLLTSGTEACYLHSSDFERQGCVQSVLSKPYCYGGKEGISLGRSEELEIGIALGLLSE